MFADHVVVIHVVFQFILILHKNGESIVPRGGDRFGGGISFWRRSCSGVFEGVSPAVYGVY
jgi:hypothetical protein